MSDKITKTPQIRFAGFTDAWEQRRLAELSEVRTGKAFSSTDFKNDGEYLIVTNKNILDQVNGIKSVGDRIDISDDTILNNYLLSGENILVTMDGVNIGKTGKFSNEKAVLAQRVGRLNSEQLEFIYQITSSNNFVSEMNKLSVGNAIKHISLQQISEYAFLAPISEEEQEKVGTFFANLDHLISLHKRKLELLKETKKGFLQRMFPKDGANNPEIHFAAFTDSWEMRKLGEEFKKVNERNDGSFGKEHWISVAKMYFQDPEKVQSNNIDTRTYVMREGDIAFEGHPNAEFKFGRFVANDIGDGVVSELFPVYRHIREYDNNYWKYAIQIERIMGPIFSKSITSSGNSSNKLDDRHFLRQLIFVPTIEEQKKIGELLKNLDHLIGLHQHELVILKNLKKSLLQQMFV